MLHVQFVFLLIRSITLEGIFIVVPRLALHDLIFFCLHVLLTRASLLALAKSILLLYLLHNSTGAKMDLKQKYPRTSSFNQLENPLNINSLIFSGHAYCLMNLRNCPMEMTLSSKNFFFPLYDYHQTAETYFMWRAVLRRQIDAFKVSVKNSM